MMSRGRVLRPKVANASRMAWALLVPALLAPALRAAGLPLRWAEGRPALALRPRLTLGLPYLILLMSETEACTPWAERPAAMSFCEASGWALRYARTASLRLGVAVDFLETICHSWGQKFKYGRAIPITRMQGKRGENRSAIAKRRECLALFATRRLLSESTSAPVESSHSSNDC